MIATPENGLYQAPYVGKVNYAELKLLVEYGQEGLARAKKTMLTPGKYHPRILGSYDWVSDENQLNSIFRVLGKRLYDSTHTLDLPLNRCISTLPHDLKQKWLDLEGAVVSTLGETFLRSEGYLTDAQFIGQPTVIKTFVKQLDRSKFDVLPMGIRYVENQVRYELRLPQGLAISSSPEDPQVLHAYSFEFTSSASNWRGPNEGREIFDSPVGRVALSQALDIHRPGEKSISLPNGRDLDYLLVVAQNPVYQGLTHKQLQESAAALGYNDVINLPFKSPLRVTWFMLNIATGNLKAESDWRNYFNPVLKQ